MMGNACVNENENANESWESVKMTADGVHESESAGEYHGAGPDDYARRVVGGRPAMAATSLRAHEPYAHPTDPPPAPSDPPFENYEISSLPLFHSPQASAPRHPQLSF